MAPRLVLITRLAQRRQNHGRLLLVPATRAVVLWMVPPATGVHALLLTARCCICSLSIHCQLLLLLLL